MRRQPVCGDMLANGENVELPK